MKLAYYIKNASIYSVKVIYADIGIVQDSRNIRYFINPKKLYDELKVAIRVTLAELEQAKTNLKGELKHVQEELNKVETQIKELKQKQYEI